MIRPEGPGRKKLVGRAGQPVWSPSGNRIAFISFAHGSPEIATVKPDGSGLRLLTNNRVEDDDPAWSPDGGRIVFTSKRDGHAQTYVMSADGSGQRRLVAERWSDQKPAWSPDGRRIVFTSFRNRDPNLLGIGDADIWSQAPTGRVCAT